MTARPALQVVPGDQALPFVWTPGTYLRLRRKAAGLSLRGVAQLAGDPAIGIEAAEEALRAAEEDRSPLSDTDLARLRAAFRFDATLYLGLLEDGVTWRDVCRRCGCSWDDACDDGGQGCAWANAARTLCTACAKKEPA